MNSDPETKNVPSSSSSTSVISISTTSAAVEHPPMGRASSGGGGGRLSQTAPPTIESLAERLFQVISRQERILEKAGIPLNGVGSTQLLAMGGVIPPPVRTSIHSSPLGYSSPKTTDTTLGQRLSVLDGGVRGRAVSDVESVSSGYATTGTVESTPCTPKGAYQGRVSGINRGVPRHSDPHHARPVKSILSPTKGARNSKSRIPDDWSSPTKSPTQVRRRVTSVQSPPAGSVQSPPAGSPDPKLTANSHLGAVAAGYQFGSSSDGKEQTLEDVQQLLSKLAAQRGTISASVASGRRQTSARFKPVSARKSLSGRRPSVGFTAVTTGVARSPKVLSGQAKLSKLKQRREAVKLQRAGEGVGVGFASGGRASASSPTSSARRPRLHADVQDKMAELEQLQQDNAKNGENHLPRERLRREPSKSAPSVQRNSVYETPSPPIMPVKPIWDPARPPPLILPPGERRQAAMKQKPQGVTVIMGGGASVKHEPLRRIASGSSFNPVGKNNTASATKHEPLRRIASGSSFNPVGKNNTASTAAGKKSFSASAGLTKKN